MVVEEVRTDVESQKRKSTTTGCLWRKRTSSFLPLQAPQRIGRSSSK